ncbi:hypothetical protein [Methylobacterium sp. Leaf108]|uniref:hypothetical protein n=1 Tax=Methylobacterium sp. Leaf108 TaxID=1736256 RepID=UPI001FCE261E|nr:hypothetical protein [Methylobacterium sp. Leaf108]
MIPDSLGGKLIYDGASCMICAGIICAVEDHVCGKVLKNYRFIKRFKSKRKQPLTRQATSIIEDIPHTIDLDRHQLPGFVTLPCFRPPQILLGEAPSEIYQTTMLRTWKRAPAVFSEKNFNPKRVIYRTDIRFDYFLRFVAKILHSYTMAIMGRGSFEPMLIDLILGKYKYPSYLIGGMHWTPLPTQELRQEIEVVYHRINKDIYLIGRLRILSNLGRVDFTDGSPVYLGVIGKIPHASQMQYSSAVYEDGLDALVKKFSFDVS